MKLLVDIGNSRVKWATLDKNGLSDSDSFARSKSGIKASLNKAWKTLEGVEKVFVSNVAGAKLASQLSEWTEKSWQITPEFINSEKRRFGVSNAYDEPEKLGSDRWLALIAARQHARVAQCVIDCGTAITVDIVTRGGQHQGGLILPGLEIMRQALYSNTDALTEELVEPEFKTLPTNTASAVQIGTMYSVTATIERIIQDLKESFNNKIRFIITGGSAETLLPMFADQVVHYPDIVLKGLAFYARQADKNHRRHHSESDESLDEAQQTEPSEADNRIEENSETSGPTNSEIPESTQDESITQASNEEGPPLPEQAI